MIKKTENIVKYKDIGLVKYVYNRKARNFTIRINQTGEVRVTVPRYGSMNRAESFLLGKRAWVQRKIEHINMQNSHIMVLKEGMILEIGDRQHILRSSKMNGSLEESFWHILRTEARHLLPGRVERISQRTGLSYTDIRIKKMKSRWGSCTSQNRINLNAWLVLLPDHLIDYVILHELVHTIHKNHSAEFWNYLDRLVEGRSKMYRQELRANKILYRIEDEEI